MKRLLPLICILILCSIPALAENSSAIIEHHTGFTYRLSDSGWRVYKPDGSLLMDFTWNTSAITENYYPNIIPLSDHLVAVQLSAEPNSPYGLADMDGNIVANAQYERVNPVSCGRIRVMYNGKFGYLDENGTWAIYPVYDLANDFSEDLAAVCIDGIWGYIDSTGETVIPPRFSEARSFLNGFAVVKEGNFFGTIDPTGTWFLQPQYERIYAHEGGLYEVCIDNKCGLLDSAGNAIVPLQYASILVQQEDHLAIVSLDDSFGLIDLARDNKLVLQPVYSNIFRAQDGVYIAEYNGKQLHYVVQNGAASEVISFEDICGSFDLFSATSIPPLNKTAALQLDASSAPLPTLDAPSELLPLCRWIAHTVYPDDYVRPDNGSLSIDFNGYPEALDYLIYGENVHLVLTCGLSAEYLDRAARNNIELTLTQIGTMPFVFFVHADNPVDSLSLEQIRRIYSGEITDWSMLANGFSGTILPYQHPGNSLCQAALEWLMETDSLVSPLLDSGGGYSGWMTEASVIAQYRNLPGAIGCAFSGMFTDPAAKAVKPVQIDGILPSSENIENGAYPLCVPIYAVTRKDNPSDNIAALLEWLTSKQGQALIAHAGILPLN